MSWTARLASPCVLAGRSASRRARPHPPTASAGRSGGCGRRSRADRDRAIVTVVPRWSGAPPIGADDDPRQRKLADPIITGRARRGKDAVSISKRRHVIMQPSSHRVLCSNFPDISVVARGYSQSSHQMMAEKNAGSGPASSTKADERNEQDDGNSQRASPPTDVDASSTSNPQKPPEPSMHDITYLPAALRPYARLARFDKPIGTFLLLHPCLWSTALASPLGSFPDPYLCALFGLGSFVMRGAGCTVNDMWDATYDREVERTRTRPLACGDVTYPQAWTFLAVQLSAGLGVLVSLPHLDQCFVWGAASLPFVATYPLMKRYTHYPQLALGVTFNWGAIMGWVAVHGNVDWSVVGPLYAGSVAWTLVYDTLYAHQDKRDDAKLGLKSTALTFGEHTKPILTALTAVAWGGWMSAGYNCGFGDVVDAPYYYTGISAAASHLLWQVHTADLNDPDNLARRFRSNNVVGWMVLGSCVAGNVMAG